MGDSTNFQLKRPAGLNKILNTLDLRDNYDRDVYIDFLKRAKASTNNPKGLSIRIGYNDGRKPDVVIRTASLCSIFFFYTKVQSTFQKVGKSASYEDVESARVSLSFYELLLLCRDFRLIPKIITKEELYYLWKVMNVQKGKQGKKVSRLVSFSDFKDFMARIAILAFNKPGIRRIILSENITTHSNTQQDGGDGGRVGGEERRIMPPAKELIGMLAKYLHLDDVEWVRNRVRTVGKATVSMINSRSTGEKNLLTRNNLREDLKGTRLAKMLSIESGGRRAVTAAAAMETTCPPGKMRPSSGTGGGGRAAAPGRIRPKSSSNTNSKLAKKLTAAQTQALALEQKSTALSPFEDQVLLMLRGLDAEDEEDGGGWGHDGYNYNNDTNDALQEFSASVASGDNQYSVTEISLPPGVPEFEGGGGAGGVKCGNLNISRVQQDALDQYHPSLAMVFDPFSDLSTFAKHKNQSASNYESTEVVSQNFLDLGSLVIGSKCVIRLNVVNDTPYEIQVQAAVGAQGGRLSTEPVKITTMPNSFCPGLSHSLFVSFIVTENVQNMSCTVANIITTSTSPTQPNFQLQNCCPVFFRAVRSPHQHSRAVQFPLCNASLLADLLDKFDLKNTLMAENNALRYNPSSNSFTFPEQKDFTHSHKHDHQSGPFVAGGANLTAHSTTLGLSSAAASSSCMYELAPGAVPAIVRGESDMALKSPVITRNPTFSNLKHQVISNSIVE